MNSIFLFFRSADLPGVVVDENTLRLRDLIGGPNETACAEFVTQLIERAAERLAAYRQQRYFDIGSGEIVGKTYEYLSNRLRAEVAGTAISAYGQIPVESLDCEKLIYSFAKNAARDLVKDESRERAQFQEYLHDFLETFDYSSIFRPKTQADLVDLRDELEKIRANCTPTELRVIDALIAHNFDKVAAAEALGVHRSALSHALKRIRFKTS